MSRKLISVVLLLGAPVPLGHFAATMISGDNTLVSASSHVAPRVASLVQSSLAQPDFSLSAMPPLQTTTPGNGASYSMNISFMTGTTGFYGNVALSLTGLPTGGTGTFTPNGVRGSGSSTLSVITSTTTPVGNYTLTITATTGRITHVTEVTLVVSDFSISIAPPSLSVGRGASTSCVVSIKPKGSLMATIRFTVTGLPAGTHSSFTPASLNNSGTSRLSISTRQTSSTGTYALTIRGTGAGVTHSAGASLTIQ